MTRKGFAPALIAALVSVSLWAFGYVPIIGAIGYLLVPTAILVCLAIIAGYAIGPDFRSRWIIGCALFLDVALAGVVSRWVDKSQSREFYAPHTVFTTPLHVVFGEPVQVTLSGPSVSSAGELRFSAIAARRPAAICEATPLACARMTSLQWAAEVTWEQPHKILGSMGVRSVASTAPTRVNIVVEEQPMSLLVTTEITKDQALIAKSVRHLPKEEPGHSPAIVLWFWHVLENNLLTRLIGPEAERIPHDLFKGLFTRALIVVPEEPAPRVVAQNEDRSAFSPPQVTTLDELQGRRADRCPVSDFAEGGANHHVHNLWSEQNSIVASIATRASYSVCAQDAFYTYDLTGDDTFTVERYDFDGTLRWRRFVRFSRPFGHDVALLRSSLSDMDGRLSATLSAFEYQHSDEGGKLVRQAKVLLHERVSFSVPTSDNSLAH